jgi:hypothetical protein
MAINATKEPHALIPNTRSRYSFVSLIPLSIIFDHPISIPSMFVHHFLALIANDSISASSISFFRYNACVEFESVGKVKDHVKTWCH